MIKLIDRIVMKSGCEILAVIIVLGGMFKLLQLTDPYYRLKNHKNLYLECYMTDGLREIDKDMITGFDDIHNTWFFKNGYSTSCRIKKINNE